MQPYLTIDFFRQWVKMPDRFKQTGLVFLIVLSFLSLSGCKNGALVDDSPNKAIYEPTPHSGMLSVSWTVKATPIPSILPPTITPVDPTHPVTGLTPPSCDEKHGVLEKKTVTAEGMSRPMDLLVYKPPCYGLTPNYQYPVLYLIHGQKQTNEQWLRLDLTETADVFFSSGNVQPYLIVLPYEELSLQEWPISSFDNDLVDGVIPWIDSHYQTCTLRACRALGGISRGALWAVEMGLSRWQLFGAIGAHSLPGAPFSESKTLKYLNAMKEEGYPYIYLDIGNVDDFLQAAHVFKGYLEKYDIPFEWHINPGGHTENYWRSHIAEYLSWYGLQLNSSKNLTIIK